MERIAARFTDRLICVAEADRATGLALGIGSAPQYRIVRSGIDVAAFTRSPEGRERVRASWGLAPDAVVVGTIANLKPQEARSISWRPPAWPRRRTCACDSSTRGTASSAGRLRRAIA